MSRLCPGFRLADVGDLTQNLHYISTLYLFYSFILPSAVRQTEGNSPERRSSPRGPAPCDEETQDGASPSEEVALDVHEATIDCPICQGSFPVGQIELHAAYCDGEPADGPPGGAVPGQGAVIPPSCDLCNSFFFFKFGFQLDASTLPTLPVLPQCLRNPGGSERDGAKQTMELRAPHRARPGE